MNAVLAVVIVDDDVDHAVIARVVVSQVAPEASVEVMTDPRMLAERLVEAPHGAIVFVDRRLDGHDGIALLAALHEERDDLCLVLLSAALTDEDRRAALASGAQAAFEKPGSLHGWRALIAAVLQQSERRVRTQAAA